MSANTKLVKNGRGDSSIVTFRVPTNRVNKLQSKMTRKPIVGINSTHQFARKLFLDFIEGKVVYLNSTDFSEDPSMGLPRP